jgi:hypothetical protein
VKDELRFDTAVDHCAADFAARLAAACPSGIDVYFENVGGRLWQAVLPLLNNCARPGLPSTTQNNGLPPSGGTGRLPATNAPDSLQEHDGARLHQQAIRRR